MTDATERRPLLWHSNAPWASTGYGQQTQQFAPRVNQHYKVGISAFYGLEGARLGFEGMTVFPAIGGDFGNKTLPSNAMDHFRGDLSHGIVLTLMDVWVLDPRILQGLNVACWVPVDHDPAPQAVSDFFEASGAIPIAMSRFGQRMLEKYDPLYVPHGIDTSVYCPIEQKQARKASKLPEDKFIVGMVAANQGNPSRKCFPEALLAFKKFYDGHPDSILYLHTEMSGQFQGVDMGKLIRGVGLPEGSVFVADQDRVIRNPLSPAGLAHFYSSFDVLLAPSAGEGFGLTVLEAAACGVPSIVTDFSAQVEVCGSGWRVDHSPYWTTQNSWQAHPDVDDIVDALKQAYRADERLRAEHAHRAREHALGYDVDTVMTEHMLPALAEVERRVGEREPTKLKAA
jgi:glycosyltransferase involved in cell wall biosynthesis